MEKLDIVMVTYQDRDFRVAEIPDVITNEDRKLLIGSHSLHLALYKEETGYTSNKARIIDEQIYAYLDDSFFSFDYSDFINKVKEYLD